MTEAVEEGGLAAEAARVWPPSLPRSASTCLWTPGWSVEFLFDRMEQVK